VCVMQCCSLMCVCVCVNVCVYMCIVYLRACLEIQVLQADTVWLPGTVATVAGTNNKRYSHMT